MKSIATFNHPLSLAVAVLLPATVLAEPNPVTPAGKSNSQTGAAASPSPNGGTDTNRNTGPSSSSTTGLGSIKDSPLSDPEALFKKLDINHDGMLTSVEFLQIQSALRAPVESASAPGSAGRPKDPDPSTVGAGQGSTGRPEGKTPNGR